MDQGVIEVEGHVAESAEINTRLVAAGCKVAEIRIQADSLEDYYFKLTGGTANV